jgi:hypothetical protein
MAPVGWNGLLPGIPGIAGIPGGAIKPPCGIGVIGIPGTPGIPPAECICTELSGTLFPIIAIAVIGFVGGFKLYGAAIGTGAP